mmetsp:Transcript_16486/g.49365  ORF Transcript_16486/g.49365 Transcript_16486/m.49365 type:complete len:200 (-) Transcript_16486:466-1065(-)
MGRQGRCWQDVRTSTSHCCLEPSSLLTAATMDRGADMAPTPVSPQASFFSTGAMVVAPSWTNTLRCFAVKGLSHMNVFIAGATSSGRLKSQARTTLSSRLSHRPPAIFARLLADRGAMRNRSAHRLSSMCSTGSPTSFQFLHSSSLPRTGTSGGSISRSCRKWLAGPVDTTRTSENSDSSLTISGTFTAATLPVAPTST